MPNPVNKIKWTLKMDKLLRDNYQSLTNTELASMLGLKLTTTRTRLYYLGLKRMDLEYWTDDQVLFLKENYRILGDTEIAEIFNNLFHKDKGWSKKHIEKKRRYLHLKRSFQDKLNIHSRNKIQGRFSINHFKRWIGKISPEGTIKIWHNEDYPTKMIKVGDKFINLARYNFETLYGKIPCEMVLIHIDGDRLNCNIENLKMITKAENCRRNNPDPSATMKKAWRKVMLYESNGLKHNYKLTLKRDKKIKGFNTDILKGN